MSDTTDFSWVGADGTLHSGSAQELMRAFVAGSVPAKNPVWRQGWSEWVLLSDALAERLLDAEAEGPPTVPESAAVPTSPMIDPDATCEELTQPLYQLVRAAPPPPRPVPPSLPLGGTTHTVPPPVKRPSLRTPMLVGAMLGLIGAVAAAGIVVSAAADAPARALQRAGAPKLGLRATPSPATAAGCALGARPVEIAPRVAWEPSLHAATLPDQRVAIGVTATEKTGFGLTLAIDPLKVEKSDLLADARHVAGVVPSRAGAFTLDRFTRSVPDADGFSLGMTPAGFTRIGVDGAQSTLWPGQAREIISRPAVVRAPDDNLAVAFRRGDADRGVVRFGWLDAHGRKKSELGLLSVASGVIAEPTLAVAADRVVVAYAARQPADAPWSIELASAQLGELPASTRRFGGEASRDRPAVAPLPGGRWLLAWVEGDRENGRRVRAQALAASLTAEGPVVEIAATPDPVGALVLHAAGPAVLVLFSERRHRQTEVLQAARISCR